MRRDQCAPVDADAAAPQLGAGGGSAHDLITAYEMLVMFGRLRRRMAADYGVSSGVGVACIQEAKVIARV
jgi:hypothetical protein